MTRRLGRGRLRHAVAVCVVAGSSLSGLAAKAPRDVVEYTGMCDASAAVAVDDRHFLVASDEDSILRLYRADEPGPPLREYDLGSRLELGRKHRETDLEAAARVGDIAYWATSHGRSADGSFREARDRFFAVRLIGSAPALRVELVGRPYHALLRDLTHEPRLAQYDLASAAERAPKAENGFNIEGLCVRAEGGLFLGLRNPVPHRRALLIPFLNPDEVIQGRTARFADPVELDLGGLGIRDLVFSGGRYLIVAGPSGGKGACEAYWWSGGGAPATRLPVKMKGLTPEAAIVYPELGWSRVQILSDDGMRRIDGCLCKDLREGGRQRFRSFWITVAAGMGR